jgi:SNF2 family DNA or RNA helicase
MNTLIPLWKDFSYFPHQQDGIRWMLDKERNGTLVPTRDLKSTVLVRGGIQCDDMGLGKTIQIIATIVNHIQKNTLLFAPSAMLETWASVAQRAGILVYQLQNHQWVKREGNAGIPRHFFKSRPAIYIANYEKVYHSFQAFDCAWDRIVLDEAHKIRNGDSAISQAIMKIQAPIRWAATGTPLVNSMKDVVSLISFIGVPTSPLWKWDKRLQQLLPQIVIHRTLDSLRAVIKEAPPTPVIHDEVLPFISEKEEDFYHGVQGATEDMMTKYANDVLSQQAIFKMILRLRQLSFHPQVYIDAMRREKPHYDSSNWEAPSTKMNRIQQIILSDLNAAVGADDTHKYIIFCQFVDEMPLIRDFLIQHSLCHQDNILLYHGGLNQKERINILNTSKKSVGTTVMLLQLQAGGVGLNLQEYDRIIFLSPWWTSALIDQAVARAVRMGQTKTVHVYHLRLAAENELTVDIDSLVNSKATFKRDLLNKLFTLCHAEKQE